MGNFHAAFLGCIVGITACGTGTGEKDDSTTGNGSGSTSGSGAVVEEYEGDDAGECSDGADNDRDGLFDCGDPDCAGAPECTDEDEEPAEDSSSPPDETELDDSMPDGDVDGDPPDDDTDTADASLTDGDDSLDEEDPTDIDADEPPDFDLVGSDDVDVDDPADFDDVDPDDVDVDVDVPIDIDDPTDVDLDEPTDFDVDVPPDFDVVGPDDVDVDEPTDIDADAPPDFDVVEPPDMDLDDPADFDADDPPDFDGIEPPDMDMDDPADLEPPLDTGRDSGESPLDIDLDGTSVDDTGSEPIGPDSPEAETGVYDTGDSDTADAVAPPLVEPIAARLSSRDYGYLFWPGNHWVTWGSYTKVRHIQTGYYAMSFDVSRASMDNLGLITEPASATEALGQNNAVVTTLPTANVSYSVISGAGGVGTEHMATEFLDRDGDGANPSELIDMGRFMQRMEIPQVNYEGSTYTGTIQLSAMTRHFVLSQKVTAPGPAEEVTLKIQMQGEALSRYTEAEWLDGSRALSITDAIGEGWSFIVPEREGAASTITQLMDGTLLFESTHTGVDSGEALTMSIIAVPSNVGETDQLSVWLHPNETVSVSSAQMNRDGSGGTTLTPATWDPDRGVYQIDLRNLSDVGAPGFGSIYTDPSKHTWYNRHRIVVENGNTDAVSIPIAFHGGDNAAVYITGGIPMLRSTEGEPIGMPMQISKNWHDPPHWYHLYSSMNLPPGSHEFEHTFAHSKWGEAYAAQHAQLSLVGWGRNQQWDESSLGCWGESITYDPDMTLGRAQVDDVRPFLVNASGEWRWTGNVGGASFLVYEPSEGYSSFASHQLGRMKTHYKYTGPNLTNVVYAGVSADGKIEANISTQLGRTDDLVRAYYHLEYTILEDVHYDRIALFQVAADRYADNGFSHYAYGNEFGTIFDEVISDHGSTGYASEADRGIPLSGESPWVMLYDNLRTGDDLPENLANVGFVIRDYELTIGDDIVTTPHLNIVRTHNGGWSQMGFELGLPYTPGASTIPAGSVLRATVEYVVPPADKSTYFGASDYLLALPADDYQSTQMMTMLAADNHLQVDMAVGTLLRSQPVVIESDADILATEFTLTGGLGYTPITIKGLARPDGWRLEKATAAGWERVDQSVEGNDYWQAYDDPAASGFDLIFNVYNRGTHTYRLVR